MELFLHASRDLTCDVIISDQMCSITVVLPETVCLLVRRLQLFLLFSD